jgi:phytoene synthase
VSAQRKSNFAWGILLLPRPKREAISALYAFARAVDDLADRPEPARAELERLRSSVAALPGSARHEPRLGDLVRHRLPKQSLVDLVDGALMDCERNRYATWDELREYCRRVAGAVGVACCSVFGPSDVERAERLAETLGIALQEINIMRDVAEDWGLGRVYLPADERDRFGVSEPDIAAGRVGAEWRALMAHQDARAERLLEEGLGLLPLLDRRSALGVRSFAGVYRGLLVQMRERGYDVFSERPRLSPVGKVRAVAAL